MARYFAHNVARHFQLYNLANNIITKYINPQPQQFAKYVEEFSRINVVEITITVRNIKSQPQP